MSSPAMRKKILHIYDKLKRLIEARRYPLWNRDAIAFFFDNLPLLLRCKETILQNEKLFFIRIFGIKTVYYRPFLGDLIRLYDDGGGWKIEDETYYFFKGKPELLFLFHIGGSPLSGINHCIGWSPEKRRLKTYSSPLGLNGLVHPLCVMQKPENMPRFKKDVPVPPELEDFLNRFKKYGFSFEKNAPEIKEPAARETS